MDWARLKIYLSELVGLDQDALHIYVAVLIQFAAALLLRRSIAHPLPWVCLLILLLVNEALDLFLPGGAIRSWQILGGIEDFWNTMALPTALLLLARYAPSLMTAAGSAKLPGHAGSIANELKDPCT